MLKFAKNQIYAFECINLCRFSIFYTNDEKLFCFLYCDNFRVVKSNVWRKILHNMLIHIKVVFNRKFLWKCGHFVDIMYLDGF